MSVEPKRGCGYRKVGGMYLCGEGPTAPCDRLPFPLDVCPTCHAGIKQTRGWTWIDAPALLGGVHQFCSDYLNLGNCAICYPDVLSAEHSAGLLWIGEKFYPTPEDFLKEARELGVSRRITAIPRNFKVGETWVLFAHPKAITIRTWNETMGTTARLDEATEFRPAIFQAFRPNRVEKILATCTHELVNHGTRVDECDTCTDERVEWEERGCTVVRLPANDRDHTGTVYEHFSLDEAAEGL